MSPKFRAALRALLLTAPFALAACGGASSSEAKPADAAKPEAAKPAKVEIFPTDMILGDAAAPVTLIEYASVTCPHCATFNAQVIPGVKEKFIDTGKLKLVYREFPTAPANYSLIGSVLARCAAEKSGKEAYFLITDALFRTQQTWIGENARAELVKIVSQAGMDEAGLNACLQRKDLVDIVNKNAKGGMDKYEIDGTPQFVLNGKKMSFKTIDEFNAQIADAVEKAGK